MESQSKAYIIAEVAQAHDGSVGNAHAFIDLAKEVGADAVKFQMHIADIESGPEETWRVNFSFQDATRFDYWRRMEFNFDQWRELKSHCEREGLDFLCSPFSQRAVRDLLELGCSVFKVASGELSNLLLLDELNEKAEYIILSTGLASDNEIDIALSRFDYSESRVAVLQCTSEYPAPLESLNLAKISSWSKTLAAHRVGLSDHSGKITPALMAYTKGARVFENHICFHKKQFGPDTPASLDPQEFKTMVTLLRQFEVMNQTESNSASPELKLENKIRFGKTLTYARDLQTGDIIARSDLETKKPANLGVLPLNYITVVGRRLKKSVQMGEYIQEDDLDIR